MTTLNQILRTSLVLSTVASALVITGCGSGLGVAAKNTIAPAGTISFGGNVHGGQQPVSNAKIQLYAISTAGYATVVSPRLNTPVMSDSHGSFHLTGDYACNSSDEQMYLTASEGNPGLAPGTNNTALVLMASLGSCGNLIANANTIFINMNEVTTVAAAWALSPFMTNATHAGTSAANIAGMQNAAASVNKLVNLATGSAPGPALPAGATLPIDKINTLANILSSCVNTDGSNTPGTNCYTLFQAATPPGGTAPTDTLTAAIDIARNAGNNSANNMANLISLNSPQAPFQPSLPGAPTNWLIGIRYIGGGLSTPKSVAIDSTGNVWVANSGNNSVSEFAPTGAPISTSTGFTDANFSAPSAIAIDNAGTAWVTNSIGNSVSSVAPLGASVHTFHPTLSTPSAIAIDGPGNIWITNQGSNSVTELNSAGTAISTGAGYTGGGLNHPIAIAINAQ